MGIFSRRRKSVETAVPFAPESESGPSAEFVDAHLPTQWEESAGFQIACSCGWESAVTDLASATGEHAAHANG